MTEVAPDFCLSLSLKLGFEEGEFPAPNPLLHSLALKNKIVFSYPIIGER